MTSSENFRKEAAPRDGLSWSRENAADVVSGRTYLGASDSMATTKERREPNRKLRSVARFGPTIGLILLVLAAWQFAGPQGWLFGVPPSLISKPSNVVKQFFDLLVNGYAGTDLLGQLSASLQRAGIGSGLAAAVGVPVGLAMGMSGFLDRLFGPIIGFLRPVPPLAWIPLVIVWFGIGEASKISVIFFTSVLFIISGCQSGVRAVPNDFYLVARNYRITGWRRVWHIILPPALPHVLAALRTGLTVGWGVVVAAELIGASSGLGYMIRNAASSFDTDTVYVGILVVGMVGLAFEYGLRFLERKLLHWQGSR